MNIINRKECELMDCPYKSCQDCKWFAGALDGLSDDGEDKISTRGACVAVSNGLDKQTYIPGAIQFVDADEPSEDCEWFEELNMAGDITESIGYGIGIAQQYPGYWKYSDDLNKMTVEQIRNSDDGPDAFKAFAWYCSQVKEDTKLKLTWVRPPIKIKDEKFEDVVRKGLLKLYGKVGDVHTIKEWRQRFKKFAEETLHMPEDRLYNIYNTTPINFMAETEPIGLSYDVLMKKDGEEWWQPLGVGY